MEVIMNQNIERLQSLITFVEQSSQLKLEPIRNVKKYTEFSRSESDFYDVPGVALNTKNSEDFYWLKIKRQNKTLPPEAENSLLQAWLHQSESPKNEPSLKTEITRTTLESFGYIFVVDIEIELINNEPVMVALTEFEDHEKIKRLFVQYLGEKWQPWAKQELKTLKNNKLFQELFLLNEKSKGQLDGKPIDLLWGIGFATKILGSETLSHPILTQKVEITYLPDETTLYISVCDAPWMFEERVFRDLPSSNVNLFIKNIQGFLINNEETITPFNQSDYANELLNAIKLVDEDGEYYTREPEKQPKVLPTASKQFNITDTWVLFARPKNNQALLIDLEGFKNKLAEIDELPPVVAALVQDLSDEIENYHLPDYRGMLGAELSAHSSTTQKELYFPLPYNESQVQIIKHLAVYNGVVVQGPPGTGKTHTIANIICHYIASGKRVLVTSMKDHALAVLRNKLPAGIQPLAISLLTSEAEGIKQFSFAVDKISAEIQYINVPKSEQEIAILLEQIDQLHSDMAHVDFQIKTYAEKNIQPFTLGQEKLSPHDAANIVQQLRAQLISFEDELNITDNFDPCFNSEDIIKLQDARVKVGNLIRFTLVNFPNVVDLPNFDEIQGLHYTLVQLADTETKINDTTFPKLADGVSDPIALITTLLDQIETVQRYKEQECNNPYFAPVLAFLKEDKNAEVADYFDELRQDITTHLIKLNTYIKRPIQMVPNWQSDAVYISAIDNLAQGEKPFGVLGFFGYSDVKKKLAEVKLVNSPPESSNDWAYIQAYIQDQMHLQTLVTKWHFLSDSIPFEKIDVNNQSPLILERAVSWSSKVVQMYHLEQSIFDQIVSNFVQGQSLIADLENEASWVPFIEMLLVYQKYFMAKKATNIHSNLQNLFQNYNKDIDLGVNDFLTKVLGQVSITKDEASQGWQKIIATIVHLKELKPYFDDIIFVTNKVIQSGAPKWGNALRSVPHNLDSLLPSNWSDLWRGARIAGYLNAINCHKKLAALFEKRKLQEQELSKTYQKIIEKKTWLSISRNASPKVRASLMAYKNAIMRIGKGTGVKAGRYRLEARSAAEEANIAVPCWIMPHYKVSESLPNEFGSFDLVIIDEASQSDLSALPAILRAKKVLIVGDDKQVSPDGAFINDEKMQQLRSSYLNKQVPVLAAQMAPDRSIYDLFKVAFADSAIMLSEHFRCAAPIIEYSKREFYNNEIKPLRVPLASERLDPPLIDVFIEDGFRKDKINPPEARFIVDEIKKIVEDPQLKNRSIGVVSLIGVDQAKLIMQMINDELGENVWQAHDIACGDAYTFQGNEKDIMFVSMIATPDQCHANTGNTYCQRYNVAASRARDRMYLVRSLQINDLSPQDDLRLSLIQHFKSPFAQSTEDILSGREACESNFEREVYDLLTAAGYRVIPQVKVGRYRIDMVVEGENDKRLAIECDGDRYHGIEQWDHDMQRQRTLERSGWVFWRSFASSFGIGKDVVFGDLKNKLTEMDIHPIKNDIYVPSVYTEYRSIRGLQEVSRNPDLAKDKIADEIVVLDQNTDILTEDNTEINQVAVGDLVTYQNSHAPSKLITTRISTGPNSLVEGILNQHTPLAQTLLGLSEGEVRELNVPGSEVTLKVLRIQKYAPVE